MAALVTVKAYIELVEGELNVKLGTRYKQLVVRGELPLGAHRVLMRYADQVVAYLHTGIDAPLMLNWTDAELKNLGLAQLETGAWTHALGDAVADRILAGVEQLDARRQRELLRGHTPRRRQIDLQPASPASGHYTYTLHKGVPYEPFNFETERE